MSIAKPALTKPWASDAPGNCLSPGGANDTGIPYPAAKSIPGRFLNWILNKIDTTNRYLVARGVPDWDVTETYSVGDRVQYMGDTYACLHPPIGNQAPSDDNYWERWGFTAGQFEGKFSDMLSAAFGTLFASAFATAFGAKVAVTDIASLVTVDAGITIGSAKAVAVGDMRIALLRFTGTTALTSFPITFADAIGWARGGIAIPFVRGSGQGGTPTYTTLSAGSMGTLGVGYLGGIGGQGATWQLDLVVFATASA